MLQDVDLDEIVSHLKSLSELLKAAGELPKVNRLDELVSHIRSAQTSIALKTHDPKLELININSIIYRWLGEL